MTNVLFYSGFSSRHLQASKDIFEIPIKGSLTQDFQLLYFSQTSFPHGPEYPIGAISIFYENSWTYPNVIYRR